MTENSSVLAAVLTAVPLCLLTLLCLRCKRKPKIIHEENQIYNPQTFQRGGSKFAVMQSKRVTNTNQMSSTSVEAPEEDDYQECEERGDYINITDITSSAPASQSISSSLEHDYVAPIAASLYENDKTINGIVDDDQGPGVYGNVFPSLTIKEDEDDYENSQFLNQVRGDENTNKQNSNKEVCWGSQATHHSDLSETDEPDYVNENQ
ncbi:uncharacterized protein KZ484_017358 isoform 1-T1 [Pholidichthys leucotaenia]